MKTVIGIDCGTQSSKVVVYNAEEKRIVASASAEHRLFSHADGTSEQEASDWVQAIRTCFAQIPQEERMSAGAVAVSGHQHGFVPVDGQGEVLYRVKLWNDTSTIAECADISEAFGAERLLSEVGNPILPGYTASKILWLKKHKPALFARLRHILLPHDYINFLLTGEYSMEFGDASGTGLLNIREREWNSELCACIDEGVQGMLPRLRSPAEGAGRVSAEAAERFGIPRGIPVATGGGDNMMSAIGTGAVSEGRLTMSLGTSGTVFAHSSSPVIDADGFVAGFCSSMGGWLPLLCTMNCTLASEELRSLLGVSLANLDAVAGQAEPGSSGLVVLPFFTGERVPNLPRAQASIMGMNLNNTSRENILRAAMESAIFGMKLGIASFAKQGMETRRITLTGGGSQSALWCQIAADVCEVPIQTLKSHDSAALGAALQALWFLEHSEAGVASSAESTVNAGSIATTVSVASIEDIVAEHIDPIIDKTTEPSPNSSAYTEAYARYSEYVNALKPLYM